MDSGAKTREHSVDPRTVGDQWVAMAAMFCGFTDSQLMVAIARLGPGHLALLILADESGGVVRRLERLDLTAQPFVSLVEVGAVMIRAGVEVAQTEEQRRQACAAARGYVGLLRATQRACWREFARRRDSRPTASVRRPTARARRSVRRTRRRRARAPTRSGDSDPDPPHLRRALGRCPRTSPGSPDVAATAARPILAGTP
jgi:hypothetical protein